MCTSNDGRTISGEAPNQMVARTTASDFMTPHQAEGDLARYLLQLSALAHESDPPALDVGELAVEARGPAIPEAVDCGGLVVAIEEVDGAVLNRLDWLAAAEHERADEREQGEARQSVDECTLHTNSFGPMV